MTNSKIPVFKERRISFRHEVDTPLELLLGNGSSITVNISNLSMRGLQFSCDKWVASEIDPSGIHHHPLNRIQLGIALDLGNNKKLKADGYIVIARRVSEDTYLIGLEFTDFRGDTESVLSSYLSSKVK